MTVPLPPLLPVGKGEAVEAPLLLRRGLPLRNGVCVPAPPEVCEPLPLAVAPPLAVATA